MGRKQRKRLELERQRKKRRLTIITIASATFIIACVVVALVLTNGASGATYKPETITVDKSSDGSVSVPLSALSTNLSYIDYGYDLNLLARIDSNGIIRTAYNTCFECFDIGAHYSLSGSYRLVCDACGNTYSINTLGTSDWGGCQPVAIPPEYRNDNDTEIVFSNELITYAEEMFTQWKSSDYDLSLENYTP